MLIRCRFFVFYFLMLMLAPCRFSHVAYAEALAPPAKAVGSAVSPSMDTVHFDDWSLRCAAPAAGSKESASKAKAKRSCEIAQTVVIKQDGKPVQLLALAVSPAEDKAKKVNWALVVLTPLDVVLTSDFGLTVDNHKPEKFRYRNCNHLGCFVVIPLTKARVRGFQKGNKGAGYFRLLNGQTVKVVFSLRGFSRAFKALASG